MNNKSMQLPPDLQELADQLATTDLSARSQIRTSLRTRLIENAHTYPKETKTMSTAPLKIKFAVAILVAVLAVSFATPGFRAWAQSWLVKVGVVTYTNEAPPVYPTATFDPTRPTSTPIPFAPIIPSDATPTAVGVDVTPGASMPEIPLQTELIRMEDGVGYAFTRISAEQAAAIAGFDVVRELSYIPQGYEFGGRLATEGWQGSINVSTTYQTINPETLPFSIHIDQSRGETEEYTFPVGTQADSVEVMIGNLPATFISNADLSSSEGWLFNMLVWVDGDYTFRMTTHNSVTQAEVLHMAESMYP